MSFGYSFRVPLPRSILYRHIRRLGPFGDKSLYKLRNVPRIFNPQRSKFSILAIIPPSLPPIPFHLLIVLSRSTISSLGVHKNCIKRRARPGDRRKCRGRREDLAGWSSFRRVEIETPRCFTVCTFRGNWKFYERPRRGNVIRDYVCAADRRARITDFFSTCALCLSIFPPRDIDRSRLTSDSERNTRNDPHRWRTGNHTRATDAVTVNLRFYWFQLEYLHPSYIYICVDLSFDNGTWKL